MEPNPNWIDVYLDKDKKKMKRLTKKAEKNIERLRSEEGNFGDLRNLVKEIEKMKLKQNQISHSLSKIEKELDSYKNNPSNFSEGESQQFQNMLHPIESKSIFSRPSENDWKELRTLEHRNSDSEHERSMMNKTNTEKFQMTGVTDSSSEE